MSPYLSPRRPFLAMSDLKLESLRVQNFRTFKDLTIDRVGRVNLIVGKNNVGKTSLLEAIHFYASYSSRVVVNGVISARGFEHFDMARARDKSNFDIQLPPERHLIYGRPSLADVAEGDSLDRLPQIRISSSPDANKDLTFRLVLNEGRNEVKTRCFVGDERATRSVFGERIPCVFVRSGQDGEHDFARIWDEVELTPKEEQVLGALRIIEEDLEGIRFKRRGARADSDEEDRLAIAKVAGIDQPEPLQSLGAGMNRLFSISLTLIDAADGILLIDEVENGLHYSAQPDLWRMIFETARELNVQVFATTHSYDCVQAFEQVAQDYEHSESMLVSLRRREEDPEDIVAVLSDRDELGTVVEENIEVR